MTEDCELSRLRVRPCVGHRAVSDRRSSARGRTRVRRVDHLPLNRLTTEHSVSQHLFTTHRSPARHLGVPGPAPHPAISPGHLTRQQPAQGSQGGSKAGPPSARVRSLRRTLACGPWAPLGWGERLFKRADGIGVKFIRLVSFSGRVPCARPLRETASRDRPSSSPHAGRDSASVATPERWWKVLRKMRV